MVIRIVFWCAMTAAAAFLATQLPMLTAIGVWAGTMAVLCIAGAALIASQPVETVRLTGMIGSMVLSWGWRASTGRLPGAVLISWLVWLAIGSTAITVVANRDDAWRCLLVVSWLILTLGLMYVMGVLIIAQVQLTRPPNSLIKLSLTIVAILIASIGLSLVNQPWAQSAALAISGGPVAIVGVGYGLFVVVILTVGRNARWN